MPGIICSLSDLVEELDNFVWLHRLSDALDQQLRYSYPAHLTHKLLRDCRYMAGHQSNSEDSENFLIRWLENGGHLTQRWSPPFVGVLPWLLDLPEEDRFGVLSGMSLGHIDILITEFCRKERLDGSATARLRHELAYDAAPHEIYRVVGANSGGPNSMAERLYRPSEGEMDDGGPEQQSLDAPSYRSVQLKPRSGGIAKPPRAYRKRGSKAKAAQFKQGYNSQGKGVPRGRSSCPPHGVEFRVQKTSVVDDGRLLLTRVKSESPERCPRRVWWERVDSHSS